MNSQRGADSRPTQNLLRAGYCRCDADLSNEGYNGRISLCHQHKTKLNLVSRYALCIMILMKTVRNRFPMFILDIFGNTSERV